MFGFFSNRTKEDYIKETKETYGLPEPKQIPKMPEINDKEYYRVGVTNNGETTLTLLGSNGGFNMTMTMNQAACEQLIRLLQSTFKEEK